MIKSIQYINPQHRVQADKYSSHQLTIIFFNITEQNYIVLAKDAMKDMEFFVLTSNIYS